MAAVVRRILLTVVVSASIALVSSCSHGVQDGCGNDVANVESRVFGIDVTTGAIRWTTMVPASNGEVVEDATHIRSVARWTSKDTVIDATTGEIIDRVASGGETAGGRGGVDVNTGAFVWRDQTIGASVDVGTTKIVTNVWDRREMERPITVRAEDPAFRVLWSTELGDRSRAVGVPHFAVVGDTVVTSLQVDVPECRITS